MPPTSTRPYVHSQYRRDAQSINPKTLAHRTYLHNKRGIELSNERDQAAFRTAKSRALKKLRASEEWKEMSAEERQYAADDIISQLEEVRDQKKADHECQWLEKVATKQLEPDEFVEEPSDSSVGQGVDKMKMAECFPADGMQPVGDKGGRACISEPEGDGDSEEWISESEFDEALPSEAGEAVLGGIREVYNAWSSVISKKLEELEEEAKSIEQEWIHSFMDME